MEGRQLLRMLVAQRREESTQKNRLVLAGKVVDFAVMVVCSVASLQQNILQTPIQSAHAAYGEPTGTVDVETRLRLLCPKRRATVQHFSSSGSTRPTQHAVDV